MPKVDPFALQPEDVIAYFRAKGYLRSWKWRDVLKEEHAKAFTVAHCVKMDILQDIKGAMDKAFSEGVSLSKFKRDLIPVLQAKGWWGRKIEPSPETGQPEVYTAGTPWRLNTIYRTNMATSYAAGRYQQMVDNAEDQPLWMYDAVNDSRTRPSHAALDGQVFPADDPFWDTHYPPQGFNCRCDVTPMSENQARRYASRNPEITINRSSEGMNFPAPDEGWDYNPGKVPDSILELAASKTPSSEPATRAINVGLEKVFEQFDESFKTWVQKVKASGVARREMRAIGYFRDAEISWAADHGKPVADRVIWLEDRLIVGKKADRHAAAGDALTMEEWETLPARVRNAEAVMWDKQKKNFLYVLASETDAKAKVIVEPGMIRANRKFNLAKTAFKMKIDALRDRKTYEVVRGGLK